MKNIQNKIKCRPGRVAWLVGLRGAGSLQGRNGHVYIFFLPTGGGYVIRDARNVMRETRTRERTCDGGRWREGGRQACVLFYQALLWIFFFLNICIYTRMRDMREYMIYKSLQENRERETVYKVCIKRRV